MANPVISNFFPPEGVIYYKPDGTQVAPDEELHIHADGTVMTEHSEIGSTNMSDTSVVVSTIMPANTAPSDAANGMSPLQQEELLNNTQSVRTQKRIRRTLNRLSSGRAQRNLGYRQSLQKNLARLQDRASQQKTDRVRINQARRGQLSPSAARRQMDGTTRFINTPVIQPRPQGMRDGSPPNPRQSSTLFGQPAELQNRRNELEQNRLRTTNSGQNLPAGSYGNDVGIDSWDQANPMGDSNENNQPPRRIRSRTGGSGGSGGSGGGTGGGGY